MRKKCIKIAKMSPSDADFKLKMHKNAFAAMALPHTP